MSSQTGHRPAKPTSMLLAAVVVLALWFLLFALIAWHYGHGVPTGTAPPLAAANDQWFSPLGDLDTSDDVLALDSLSPAGEALMVWNPVAFDAADWPVLTLQLENFPYNYVLMAAWKTATDPRTRFTRLQTANGSPQTYLMSRLSEWEGRITELALYLYPQPQTSPPVKLEQPIILRRLTLASDSWLARGAALKTQWLAPDPWAMISPSSLGVYSDLEEGVGLTPVLFAMLLMALPVVGFGLGSMNPMRWLRLTGYSLLVVAVLVQVRWIHNLAAQTRATAGLFSADDSQPAWRNLYDRDLAFLVDQARLQLPPPPDARVLVAADARFFRLRAAWHLRPHNVLPFLPGEDLGGEQHIRPGDFLFVYRRPDLLNAAAAGVLKLGNRSLAVRTLLNTPAGGLLLFESGP